MQETVGADIDLSLIEHVALRGDRVLPKGTLMGPYVAGLLNMDLRWPEGLKNERTRFYFTEAGWARVGKRMAAEAKRDGILIKVIRRKRPDTSQIVYEDEDQLAILPRKSSKRARHRVAPTDA
jgi:hypothetical protein